MLVSICIACYNAEQSIRTTLTSIKNQSYENFEVIIVDDNSVDNTVRIIYDEFCLRDKRFKLFVNNTTEKYYRAHNLSYQYAKGEYLFRVDQDDILFEDYLQFHIDFLNRNPEVDAFSTKMKRYKYENNLLVPIPPEEDEMFLNAHAKDEVNWFNENNACSYCGNTILWSNPSSSLRKAFYDKYNPKYISYALGDYVFWWNVIAEGGKLYKSEEEKSIHCNYTTNSSDDEDFYWLSYEGWAKLCGFQEKAFLLQGEIETAEEYKNKRLYYENLCKE